jgi:hypothetical protein
MRKNQVGLGADSMLAERKAVAGPTAWPIENVEEAATFPSPGKSC